MAHSIQDLLAAQYQENLGMLKVHLKDLNDADLLTRPAPNANHANWQLGHVTLAEAQMTGNTEALPRGFAEKYKSSNATIDDSSAFSTKEELLATLDRVRAGSVNWMKGLTPEMMEQPSPESIRMLAPTLIKLALLIPTHLTLHIGQIQVLRRKLGKPVLF